MAKVFREGQPNFPANQAELDKRLTEIEQLINNDKGIPQVNVKFSEAAFQLMQDCDLITESNVKFLSDAQNCKNYDSCLFFIRNRSEGALRQVNDDGNVNDAKGDQRFYYGTDRRVELSDGRHFLISNDWYKDKTVCPNKRAFYNWLKKEAQDACKKHEVKDDNVTASSIINTDYLKRIIAASGIPYEKWHKHINVFKALAILLEKAKQTGELMHDELMITLLPLFNVKNDTDAEAIENVLSIASIESEIWNICNHEGIEIIDETTNKLSSKESKKNNLEYINMEFRYSRIYSGEAIRINKYIGSAKHVVIPARIDDLPVKYIGERAFSGCTNLTTVIIEGFSHIGENAFSGCTNLITVVINRLLNIGKNAFSGCTSLRNLILPYLTEDYYEDGFFAGDFASIGTGAFSGCTSLPNVIIPDGVHYIGDSAFSGCTSLINVMIERGVNYIGYSAFSGCTCLTNVIIPYTVEEIGDGTFCGCENLEKITIPYGVHFIGNGAFSGCTRLTNVIIEDNVEEIGERAFSGCTWLTEINIQGHVEKIGDLAFDGCESLTEITIKYGVEEIGDLAFWGCSNLRTVYVSESALSEETIRRSIDKIRTEFPSCRIIPIPQQQ